MDNSNMGYGGAPAPMDNGSMGYGGTPVQTGEGPIDAERLGAGDGVSAIPEKNDGGFEQPVNANTAVPFADASGMGYTQTPNWPDNTGYSGYSQAPAADIGWNSANPAQANPDPAAPQNFGQMGYGQPYSNNNPAYGQGYQQPGYGQGYPGYNPPNQGFGGYPGQTPNPQPSSDGSYPAPSGWNEQKPQS